MPARTSAAAFPSAAIAASQAARIAPSSDTCASPRFATISAGGAPVSTIARKTSFAVKALTVPAATRSASSPIAEGGSGNAPIDVSVAFRCRITSPVRRFATAFASRPGRSAASNQSATALCATMTSASYADSRCEAISRSRRARGNSGSAARSASTIAPSTWSGGTSGSGK